MHILIPAIIDVQTSAPNRLHQFIKCLSKNHKITVVCIKDFWKSDQIDNKNDYKDFSNILSNIGIQYFSDKRISPIIQEFLSPIFLKQFKNDSFDMILNYNTLISGKYLAKKFKIPMVYDIADDLPAMIRDSPQISWPFNLFGEVIGNYEVKSTIKNSKNVTGINEIFKEKYHIPTKKFHLIPNGVNTKLFTKRNNNFKEILGLKNDFVLGYVGVLREWVDFTPVYNAIKNIPNIKLLIVGQEGNYKENKEQVKKLDIENKVVFAGNVSYENVPNFISAMDVCLIPFKINDITEHSFPLKLLEYLACEKLVISSRLKGVEQIMKNKIFYADTEKDYLENIQIIMENKLNFQSMKENNRLFVEETYTWQKICNSMKIMMESH